MEEGGPLGEAANLKGMAIREAELEWIKGESGARDYSQRENP